MNIEIDSDITPPPATERRKSKRAIYIPPGVKTAIQRYKDAYKVVFQIPPEVFYDGTYVRIRGSSEGVTMKRLREMIKQLRWRAG
jgi:hypothetical protein